MIEGFFHERSIFIYNIQEKKNIYIYIYILIYVGVRPVCVHVD